MPESTINLINTDFEAAIARNKDNTLILITVLTLIAAVLGYVMGWAVDMIEELWQMPASAISQLHVSAVFADLLHLPPRRLAVIGAWAMLGGSALWGVVTLYAGAHILGAFVGARDAHPSVAEEKRFIDVVEEMAIAAGLPMPRPMVVDSWALNAFASGYSPKRAVITVTRGLLRACPREELQGVIGHEMGHVLNFDVRYATVVAAMVGVIAMVQHLLFDLFGWNSPPPARSYDDDDDYVPMGSGSGNYVPGTSSDKERDGADVARIVLILVVIAIFIVFALITGLSAKLVQLAISRQREFLADATSVKLTRSPLGLIHALERLEGGNRAMMRGDSPISALCIAPVRQSFASAFATHPATEDRIARLQNLGDIDVAPGADDGEASQSVEDEAPELESAEADGRSDWR